MIALGTIVGVQNRRRLLVNSFVSANSLKAISGQLTTFPLRYLRSEDTTTPYIYYHVEIIKSTLSWTRQKGNTTGQHLMDASCLQHWNRPRLAWLTGPATVPEQAFLAHDAM